VGWLKQFATEYCAGLSTLDVVLKVVKTHTLEMLCRYVDILKPGDTGRAQYFFSHTWAAPFNDLVAAAGHVCSDDDFVWIDIFAVLQHTEGITKQQEKEKEQDLDFHIVVRSCKALILVAQHIPTVAGMNRNDAIKKLVPPEAKKSCAFFRVWCIVELLAARDGELPTIMLVGNADSSLRFRTNDAMLDNLLWMMDIEQASASYDADRVRILEQVRQFPGFVAANQSFKGAVAGAMRGCMNQPAVIRAALGDVGPLSRLSSEQDLAGAIHGAAAAGLMGPLQMLLQRGVSVDMRGQYEMTPLISAAQAGQVKVVHALLGLRADPNAKTCHGVKAIDEATVHGHTEVVQLLQQAGSGNVDVRLHAKR